MFKKMIVLDFIVEYLHKTAQKANLWKLFFGWLSFSGFMASLNFERKLET
jgi:hypothetical protein